MHRTASLPLSAATAAPLLAQPFNSTGREHWVAFMENLDLQWNNAPSFHLVISSEIGTTGEITVPATGFTIPFTIGAGAQEVITLPQNIYYGEGDEAYFNFGLRVSSEQPVSVYAYHDRMYFTGATMILPTASLGTEYLVSARADDLGNSPSEFVVLATQPGTVVEIVPSTATASFRPPDQPFTITLAEGQTFQLQAYEDLSGTRVRSVDPDKPIAVFAGARQSMVNCVGGADDHIYEQIHPLAQWGTHFTIVPFVGRMGDQVRILAGTDGTTVHIGSEQHQLDAGDVLEADIARPTVVHADQPIAVSQFNDSQDCNAAPGDPCFVLLPHTELTDDRCIWNARTGDGTPEHFVNVVVESGSGTDPVLLDGTDIAPQLGPVLGTTGLWYAGVPIAAGGHELSSSKPFQAIAYGFGDYNAYGYALGFEQHGTNGIDEHGHGSRPYTQLVAQGSPWWPTWVSTGPELLRVTDLRGRTVLETTYRAGAPVEVGALPAGIYAYERRSTTGRIGTGRLAVH